MKQHAWLAKTIVVCLVAMISITAVAEEKAKNRKLESAKLGATRNVHSFGNDLLCGQPTAEDFAEAKNRGIKVVLTLRERDEVDWDEAAIVKKLGLEFHQFGFRAPDSLTDEIFDRSLSVLKNSKKSPVLLHCASANRVGAVWLAHRVLNDGLPLDKARGEAKQVGLRTDVYEAKALDYIKRRKATSAEQSVRPGINDRFLEPKLEIGEWLNRFEIESREVYSARTDVLRGSCPIGETGAA